MNIRSLIRREELGAFLNANGYENGTGLEVGTYKGDFAALLASTWKCSTLWTCDPWRHYDGYVDGCVLDWSNNKAPADLEKYREEAEAKLAKFANVRIVRTSGVDMMGKLANGSLALVYLDGAHDYDTVARELRIGWEKLEPGGILGTHDTYTRHDSEQHCDVWRAVWEFAHEVNQRPHLSNCTSSWFVK